MSNGRSIAWGQEQLKALHDSDRCVVRACSALDTVMALDYKVNKQLFPLRVSLEIISFVFSVSR